MRGAIAHSGRLLEVKLDTSSGRLIIFAVRLVIFAQNELDASSGRFLEELLGVVVEVVVRQAEVAGGRPRALRRTAHPSDMRT